MLAVFGKLDEDSSYPRLGALQLHLFGMICYGFSVCVCLLILTLSFFLGYELHESIMLFVAATQTLHMLVEPKAGNYFIF